MTKGLTRYKLGDLIEVTRGQSLAGEYYAESGEYIRLTLANFDYQNGGFKDDTQKSDIYYTGPVRQECLLNEGDIITPLTEQALGLLGSTARIPISGKYVQSGDVALIKCNEELIDPSFCYYLLPSAQVKKQLAAGSQQTKIRHTSPDAIKTCVVDIPCLEDQRKIGRIMDSITGKISLNRSINKELEQMAKEIYDYWFVQFDFPDENGRPYKSSGGAMVYNPVLKREIPEGWDNCVLGDYADMYQPKTLSSQEVDNKEGFRVYGANGKIGKYQQYNHENSEIAMACRGNSCGVLNRTMPFSWITGNAMVVRPKRNPKENEFLYHALSYMNINGAITGSGQPQLTRENLSKVKMVRPSESIISEYNNTTAYTLKMRIELEEMTDLLLKQRDELLPLLMTGQAKII